MGVVPYERSILHQVHKVRGEVNMHLFSCFSFSHKPLCFQGEAGKLSEEGGTSSIDRLPHRFALKISLHSQRYL